VKKRLNFLMVAARPASWRRALRYERGIAIVEVCVATMVAAAAITGVIRTMSSGFSLVGQARQRSLGTSVAEQAIEHAHNLDYGRVALNDCVDPNPACPPAHSTDASNPDFNVSENGRTYDSDGSAGPQPSEPLIVDTTNGALPHIEDPVTVGVTQFNIYQYVTWVDDPKIPGTQNYKRVVVVVTWEYPARASTLHSVTRSTLIRP